jgi:predicted nucleotide-binding protein
MARPKGSKNRNYPVLTLEEALEVAQAIQDDASGMQVSRLTLAGLMDRSPSSSIFADLVASSRAYGLTTGGGRADQFQLTELGERATSDDEEIQQQAKREAVLKIEPFEAFLTSFKNKKVPAAGPFKDFLINKANVPADRAGDCMNHILADARDVGFIRTVRNGEFIDLDGQPVPKKQDEVEPQDEEVVDEQQDEGEAVATTPALAEQAGDGHRPSVSAPVTRPSAIFVGHGKKRGPLDKVQKILDEFKVPYKVVVDLPNLGRPIPDKVKQTMEQCGSAILIFTKDEEFRDAEGKELWRPSENVVYELGAASYAYEDRVVILKEKGITFPTNFNSIGYIEFEENAIDAKAVEILKELIGFGLVKITTA